VGVLPSRIWPAGARGRRDELVPAGEHGDTRTSDDGHGLAPDGGEQREVDGADAAAGCEHRHAGREVGAAVADVLAGGRAVAQRDERVARGHALLDDHDAVGAARKFSSCIDCGAGAGRELARPRRARAGFAHDGQRPLPRRCALRPEIRAADRESVHGTLFEGRQVDVGHCSAREHPTDRVLERQLLHLGERPQRL
jgi:hypothetical protein